MDRTKRSAYAFGARTGVSTTRISTICSAAGSITSRTYLMARQTTSADLWNRTGSRKPHFIDENDKQMCRFYLLI